ncbi:PREDICTED: uncharacterized protein LOC106124986 isoform X1 [Papilio xuthus]|uniref:Uncharacterized protein LOC106124986 isoform X1 n=1 Tax=Papilio xuthus TaxID=66420 RepID=A0AAJ7EHF7_PAPXU|nr:PREDICTED: uncharacterized protein LOC106124986 isoform X1 [Papilio xuthus]
MMKLCPVLFVIGFIFINVEGAPFDQNDISAAAANGDWNTFHRLIQNKFRLARNRIEDKFKLMRRRLSQGFDFKPNFDSIRSLQPDGPDSNVYGEAQYSFHSSSNVNGQKSEQRGGRRIVNKNGVVEEYELP